ncbi:MAG: hypothetical protein QNJ72_44445 [Pleurocapsa sp. MO_226.B13]|nr:hypothetical protein [Pleurocapsa sp. MO_226.B13]
MLKGLYLRGVMDLLGLSESAINKLVDDGHLKFSRTGNNGKRVFDKAKVQEFKNSPLYRSLKKQTVVVYLRCSTKGQERTIGRQVVQYCKQNNFKANIVSQLDRGRQEVSQSSYKIAISYIFEQTDIAGLIYYGKTSDITELRKIFQAKEDLFILNAANLDLEDNSKIVSQSETAHNSSRGPSLNYI